jgi:hypothetical protein
VALTRAATASSGDLKDCCALATETDAKMTAAAVQQVNLPINENIRIMTISPILDLRVSYADSGRNPRTGANPVVVGLEL